MYSEIKDNNRILINRLNDSEKILMQDICNRASKSEISFKPLDGETGDFEGVMLTLTPIEPKVFEFTEEIPTSIETNPNEIVNIQIPIEETDVDVLVKIDDYVNFKIESMNNTIAITALNIASTVLKYEIKKDGYESVYGEIEINSVARETVSTSFYVVDEDNKELTDSQITVKDSNDTELLLNEETGRYDLKVGSYHLTVSKEGYRTHEETLEITEANLMQSTLDYTVELIADGPVFHRLTVKIVDEFEYNGLLVSFSGCKMKESVEQEPVESLNLDLNKEATVLIEDGGKVDIEITDNTGTLNPYNESVTVSEDTVVEVKDLTYAPPSHSGI